MKTIFVRGCMAYFCVFSMLFVVLQFAAGIFQADAYGRHDATFLQDGLAKHIFALQKQGKWDEADASLVRLDNEHPLKPYAQAQRYLKAEKTPLTQEAQAWAKEHAALPVASLVTPAPAKKKIKPQHILFNATLPHGWRNALQAYKAKHYSAAREQFTAIAQRKALSPWYRSAAHYWSARCFEALGDVRATNELAKAATHEHTFYGMLAQQALNATANQQQAASTATLSERDFATALRRISLLGEYNEHELLTHEIETVVPQLSNEQYDLVLDVLQSQDIDIDPALRSHYVHTVSGYQVPDWFPEDAIRMDRALVLSVVRQESRFNPAARNPHSGAAGLMQILPQTAQYMEKRYQLNETKLASLADVQISPVTADRIRDPKVNLIVGQNYLSYLAKKSYIHGNLIYTLAAYNAGPGNLIDWQKRFADTEDPLLFIESIPFKETRQYVIQVLANQQYYQRLNLGHSVVGEALLEGRWPSVQPL